MRHGSLFSGGGGFDIAAEWMGWENVFHCEVNPFAKKILKYWWPAAISYDDITKTDFSIHRGSIDILTGGFPCQPFSNAGQQKGTADPRYLWPEMLRAIREIRPRWIVGENVYGLVNWSGGLVFDTIKSDLENEGYEVIPVVLPAAGVNAPHNRARIWFIAKDTNEDGWSHYQREGQPGKRGQRDTGAGDHERVPSDTNEIGDATNSECIGQQGSGQLKESGSTKTVDAWQADKSFYDSIDIQNPWDKFPTQPPVLGRNDGLPDKLDGITFSEWSEETIMMYGNAVVPELVMQIFKTIELYERLQSTL
jgi:DNA (cytosine-5)-methyltransferase 1